MSAPWSRREREEVTDKVKCPICGQDNAVGAEACETCGSWQTPQEEPTSMQSWAERHKLKQATSPSRSLLIQRRSSSNGAAHPTLQESKHFSPPTLTAMPDHQWARAAAEELSFDDAQPPAEAPPGAAALGPQ